MADKKNETGGSETSQLDEYRTRLLHATIEYIGALLDEIEGIIEGLESRRKFSRIYQDLSPEQRAIIEDSVVYFRERLLGIMESGGVACKPPFIPASRAVTTKLISIHIALEELKTGIRGRDGNKIGQGSEEICTEAQSFQDLVSELECIINDNVTNKRMD